MPACRRRGAVAAAVVTVGVCLSPPIVAQSPDADTKLQALIASIEMDLASSAAMPPDIMTRFTTVTDMARNASVPSRQMLIDMPKRLREKSEEEKKAGFLIQAIDLDVFGDYVGKYLAEHPVTAIQVMLVKPTLAQPDLPKPVLAQMPSIDQDLVQRGDTMLEQRNVSAARLLYMRAATDGVGVAALKLGNTYDPAFIAAHHLLGLKPDPQQAEAWYHKAADLGESQADQSLKQMASHTDPAKQ